MVQQMTLTLDVLREGCVGRIVVGRRLSRLDTRAPACRRHAGGCSGNTAHARVAISRKGRCGSPSARCSAHRAAPVAGDHGARARCYRAPTASAIIGGDSTIAASVRVRPAIGARVRTPGRYQGQRSAARIVRGVGCVGATASAPGRNVVIGGNGGCMRG